MTTSSPAPPAPPAPVPPVRRPYTKPSVTSFGSIAKLTQGGSGTKIDGGNHTKK